MAKPERHWRRLQKLFSAVRPHRHLLAASAALGVDRCELRRQFDRPLTSAEVHDLDTRLLAAAEAHVEDVKRKLAEAEALREEIWIATQVSHRDAYSTVHVDLTDDHGVLRKCGFYPWETGIAELLAEENAQ